MRRSSATASSTRVIDVSGAWLAALPLFPLQTVLFPGGRLALKVFEARYLDMTSTCLRTAQPFGVVCLREGAEAGGASAVEFEPVGVLAHIDEVDADRPGILQLACTGGQRFRIVGDATQRGDGLWSARVQPLADDVVRAPAASMHGTVAALADALRQLHELDRGVPASTPVRLDDAGWVANRWCELLPISLAAKQKLMELDDPVIRLSLVDGYLRDRKVVVG